MQDLGGTVRASPPDTVSVSQRSQVGELTTNNAAGTSIIGGRNEQAQNRQNRRVAPAVTTQRHVQSATPIASRWEDPAVNTTADNECDTNADICCLGKNFVVLNATFRTADVYAYDTYSFSRVSFRKSTRFFYRSSSILHPSIRVHLFTRKGWPPSHLPFFHLHLLFQPCPRKIVLQQISMKLDLFVRVSNRQI